MLLVLAHVLLQLCRGHDSGLMVGRKKPQGVVEPCPEEAFLAGELAVEKKGAGPAGHAFDKIDAPHDALFRGAFFEAGSPIGTRFGAERRCK